MLYLYMQQEMVRPLSVYYIIFALLHLDKLQVINMNLCSKVECIYTLHKFSNHLIVLVNIFFLQLCNEKITFCFKKVTPSKII